MLVVNKSDIVRIFVLACLTRAAARPAGDVICRSNTHIPGGGEKNNKKRKAKIYEDRLFVSITYFHGSDPSRNDGSSIDMSASEMPPAQH